MSGVEAGFVLGLITSIFAVITTCNDLYKAANNAKGLPEAFQKVYDNIPLVLNILHKAEELQKQIKTEYERTNDPAEKRRLEDATNAAKPVMEGCRTSAEALKSIFEKVIPGDDTGFMQRYLSAARGLKPGRSQRVEDLMRDILTKLQLLHVREGFKAAVDNSKIQEAIDELARVPPSLPDGDEATYKYFGSGIQHMQGDIYGGNYSQNDGGTMNFVVSPPKPPLVPTHNIPFSRDPQFVERQELVELQSRLSIGGARLALVGIGGIGKSQLAIEYLYWYHENNSSCWTFWINASNRARFERSVRDIADMIELPGRGDRKADIFRLFNQWLRDPRNKQWQIVLDNVDDLAFLQPASSGSEHLMNPQANVRRSLTEYIPHCLHGSVMITSRSRNAACELVGYENILSIGPMGDAEALSLLATKLYGYDSERQSADEADRAELVSALDLVPLAVSQAAAFIMRQARYTIRQYLEALGKACVDGDVLSRNIRDLRRDNEDSRGQAVPDSVLLTWCLSFDQIRATRSTAADMLSLMSFCDRQAIPEVLLHCRDAPEDYRVDEESVEPPESQSGQETSGIDARASGDFEDDLSLLKDYSFITLMGSQSTFSIHGLVQLATRRWLHHHGQFERWKKQLINNVAATMPTGEFKDWKLCQTLYAHAKAALEWEPNEEEVCSQWVSLLTKVSSFAIRRGLSEDAEMLAVKLASTHTTKLGTEHPKTLASVSNLAIVLRQQGKYQAAEAMNRRALERKEKVLGIEHPETLTSVSNLAIVLRQQGKYQEAEAINRRALEGKEKVLGIEHPSTLTSVSNLADVLQQQGKYQEAEAMNRRALEGSEKVLGIEHPETLISVSNLADVLQQQGKYQEAEAMSRRTLEGSEKMLGSDHPYTLQRILNLAVLMERTGRKVTAALLLKRIATRHSAAPGRE